MAKEQDHLPEAERFMPLSREEALLLFGPEISKMYGNQLLPTDTLPGSQERIEVYRQRAAERKPIFHPEDRTSFEGVGGLRKRPTTAIGIILAKLEARPK